MLFIRWMLIAENVLIAEKHFQIITEPLSPLTVDFKHCGASAVLNSSTLMGVGEFWICDPSEMHMAFS